MDLFSLVAKITLDSSEYNDKLEESEKNFKTFGSKLKQGVGTAAKIGATAVAAVGGATVAVTKTMLDGAKETAEYGDNIDKMSQKIGISAEAYQEWDAILQHNGASVNTLQSVMRTLSNQAQKNSDVFQKLGISQEEVASLSKEDLFSKVVSGLQNMEEGTERTYLATQLLGRGAMEFGALLNSSAQETEDMRKRVHELGGVMSDEAVKSAAAYQDSLQDMNTAMSGLKRNIMSEFLPSIVSVMDGVSDLFTTGDTTKITEGINSFVDKIGETIPKVVKIGGKIVIALASAIVKGLPKAVETIVQTLPVLLSSLMSGLPQVITVVEQIFYSLTEALPDLLKIILGELPSLIPLFVTALVNFAVFLMENIDELLQPVIDALPSIIEAILVAVFSNLPKLIEGCIQLIGSLFSAIVQVLGGLLSMIFDPIFKWLGDVFSKAWAAVSGFFSDIWDAVSGAFGKAAKWVYDTIIKPVADFFKGLWEGIVSAFHTVIDPWIEIIKRASKLVYDSIIKPVLDFFKGLWEDIKEIWQAVSGWFNEHVIEPVKNLFSEIWASIKEKASDAWEGIKNTFRPVADWFHDIFSKAWQKVKDVFSTGGKVFSGIKEGIENTFKTVVNVLIGGINKIIAVPFRAINRILEKIHDIEILGVSPFDWVHTFEIPELPKLAKGGIANRPVIAGEDGAEAIIPLERNKEWIQSVATEFNSLSNNSESVKLMEQMLEEMRTIRQDMFSIILSALRTNSDGFNISERDMARLVKKYAFA